MGRSIFADSYAAPTTFTSDWYKDGSGVAVILENLKKTSDDSEKFIARHLILSVTKKGSAESNNVGEQVGWVQNYTIYPKMAKKNVQQYILAIVGQNIAQIKLDDFVATCEDCINYTPGIISEYNGRKVEDVQAARGMLIKFDTYRHATKAQKAAAKPGEAPNTLCFVNFTNISEQNGNSPEEITKRRAELDVSHPIRG